MGKTRRFDDKYSEREVNLHSKRKHRQEKRNNSKAELKRLVTFRSQRLEKMDEPNA